ncbi:MAG: 50S ribosomal protein L9 [Lachnoanaerobaculum sp.]|jgi:ribosomal protein L9|uniref:50S ribosomal protein L9 n=1 Tax=Lachnoanaerobaculum TaxID=1164882 RepID=UPI00027A619B|nr:MULTISPECIES: 50S ribosomal protein L9 [Lachnoanaerobaculum]RKW54355.1 MAG: 50S ribosomal protein L9 [Lachnospiraceae bacterium]EJP18533.1 ribosomal protein L9 [Lachnoanaerobaculum sp. ICM7]EJZ70160.1 ribosomal protein L9 [Lachnoanaerobaculum sp. OBRC5-5]MBS5882209.1 50S ribosomal protein L9 [Lachnoanaerobaculum sp.]WHE86180.1 50S ribosomal protein L9 [Lachnoanaerobaculum gingivalis]
MKVVLLEDVKSLGKKGDIVEVSEGYARNFIIPKKKGVEANQENLNTLKLQKANEEKIAKEKLEAAKELAAKLNEASVSLTIKGGKDGRTFGSVSSKEIEEAIKSQLGLEIDKKKLVIAEPIKTFGNHEVKVKLHKDVTAALKVKVGEE